MTTILPFCLISVAGVDADMIPVGFGALLGLGIFIRGFHLLQNHRPALQRNDVPRVPDATHSPAHSIPKREVTLAHETHREIIRLSPPSGEENSGRPRTQQGQIAAALLKAGIANPISWTPAQISEVTIRTMETHGDRPDSPASLIEALDLNASTALQEGLRISKSTHKAVPQEFRWKPALMIWGGPLLSLGCIYLLAAHYGWL